MSNESVNAFLSRRFERQDEVGFRPAALRFCAWFDELLGLLFVERASTKYETPAELQAHATELQNWLADILDAEETAAELMLRIPELHATLIEDAQAIVAADPAATGLGEVVAVYGSFYAIAAYRVAHELAQRGVPLLPRALAEYAHGRTGVDIHPDAVIGRRFCIDHGTGTVIGQTTIIGDDVRLYQGVTLGGTSLHGADHRNTKRHPTVQDRVIIYANATVLGGDTVIGHDSVLGGNVWVTASVPPYSKVVFEASVRTVLRAEVER